MVLADALNDGHRRAVPRSFRVGPCMTALQMVHASPEPATLADRALPARPFEGLLGTDGVRYGLSTFADREGASC